MSAPRRAETALAEIDSGHFARARDIARDIISQDPRDAAALRALGIAEFRLGRHKDAIEALRRSLRIDPSQTLAHLALANVLQDQGQLHSAITSYRRALRLDPDSAPAHNDLGTALYASGNIEEAIREFEKALKRDSRLAMTYENLGSALRRAGRFADARRAFSRSLLLRIAQGLRRLLGLRPPSGATLPTAKATAAIAIRLHTEGKIDEALVECEKLLAADPDNAEALHIKGLSRIDRNDPESALPLLERAAALQPSIPEFQNSLGIGLRKLERTVDALEAYARAIELNPDFTEALVNLGQLSADLEIFDQAERAARSVLTVQPESLVARHTLARALQGQGKYEEMERISRETLALDRSQVDSWLYLGQALREQNQITAAREAFEEALRLGPDVPMVHLTLGVFSLECKRDAAAAIDHYRRARLYESPMSSSCFNESLTRFAMGDYSKESWDLYEARRSQGARAAAYRKMPLPEWQGPSDAGQSLLIYGEQGIGDEIMFSSMVPEAAGIVRRCVLACDPQLRDLFARSFPNVTCVAWPRENLKAGAPQLHGATAAIPMGSLGRFFRSSHQKFPGPSPYLIADPVKTEGWRARLRQIGSPPYYGVAWQGGLWKSGRGRRSIPLSRIMAQLKGADARWVSLQKAGATPIEEEARGTPIVHWQDALDSADDCAALVAALDGVISVCSWIVHLAGALGKEVLVLAPFAPEWRYGLNESRMIWYPSAKILRQNNPGKWDSVLENLREELPRAVEPTRQTTAESHSPMRYNGGAIAIYDFQSSPYTYDLISFLTNARENGCHSVAFVPGERPSKLTKNQERYRWENLLLPLARLWGEVYICATRAEARKLESDCRWPRNYKVDAPTFGHTLDLALGMRSPEAIKPSPAAIAWAASRLGDLSKTVTLTIRRSVANPGRDSKLAAWVGFARHVAAQGYRPIFIPDTEKPEMETSFEVCAEAAFDIDKRLALYSAAMLNTGVNNGPMGLCWYTRTLPYLTLKMEDRSQRETSREYFIWCGWIPGTQYPWVGPNQQIVWEDDTEDHLVAAFQQWLTRRQT